MRVYKETCQLGPSGGVVEFLEFGVRNGGRKSEKNPGLADFMWIDVHEGEEELVAEFNGVEEFIGLLATNKLDILLES